MIRLKIADNLYTLRGHYEGRYFAVVGTASEVLGLLATEIAIYRSCKAWGTLASR